MWGWDDKKMIAGEEDDLVWEDSGDENGSDDETDFEGFNAQDVEQAGNLATITSLWKSLIGN